MEGLSVMRVVWSGRRPEDLARALRQVPTAVGTHLAAGAEVIGREWQREMAQTLRSNVYVAGGGRRSGIGTRSGALARSMFSTTGITPGSRTVADVTLRFGSRMSGLASGNYNYARIHEFGGTIRPRSRKYLTIPLRAALTPSGVLRKPARQWPGAFFLRSRAGRIFLAHKRGGQVELLFALVTRVQMPARLGMRRRMIGVLKSPRSRATIRDALRRGLRQAIQRGEVVRG